MLVSSMRARKDSNCYFDHRQLHDRAHGSSKIRNSVDNNLLLKIRFRQKSITFSAVDINRKF